MSREKSGYRDTIALLNARYPDHDMLTAKEVMAFCGISFPTVKKRIRFNAATGKITKADLARQVCV